MNDKDKNILIRISNEMSDQIKEWSAVVGLNKSSFVRKSVAYYIETLSRENKEVLELIKGIIITKIDKVQNEYNDGKIIAFTQITKINTAINCNLCKDEFGSEYVVYNIVQSVEETMVEAIHRFAKKLYSIWQGLDQEDQRTFLIDLQLEHVYFSIQLET
jgi:predicted DNA-binding protein